VKRSLTQRREFTMHSMMAAEGAQSRRKRTPQRSRSRSEALDVLLWRVPALSRLRAVHCRGPDAYDSIGRA